jgi:hypothetical protein
MNMGHVAPCREQLAQVIEIHGPRAAPNRFLSL